MADDVDRCRRHRCHCHRGCDLVEYERGLIVGHILAKVCMIPVLLGAIVGYIL